MPYPSSWHDVLDLSFVQRLLRPWLHPGRIDPGMAQAIATRYRPMTPLPLVEQLIARQHRTATQPSFSQPIVYAQPSPLSIPSTDPIARPQSTGASTVIQAKFVSSSGLTAAPSLSSQHLPDTTQPSLELSSSANQVDQAELPLLQPIPPSLTDSLPPLRPRRPRFERDIDRSLVNSSPQLSPDSEEHATSMLSSSDPVILPSALTVSSDLLNLAINQPSPSPQPVVEVTQALLSQNQPTDSSMPLVAARVPQLNEIGDRPPTPGVASKRDVRFMSAPTTALHRQAASPLSLPRVQISQLKEGLNPHTNHTGFLQPLVFAAQPTSGARGVSTTGIQTHGSALGSWTASESGQVATGVERATGSLIASSQSNSIVGAQPQVVQPSSVDVDALADKVERKLMRRLVVERERRGWSG